MEHDMDPSWHDLAARLRAAAAPPTHLPRATPAAPDAARDALRASLASFAAALEVVQVGADGEVLTWSTALRTVRFAPARHGFDVTWTEPVPRRGRIVQEPVLDDRWVLEVHGVPSGDRLPLFPQGLTRLVVQGLDLPAPSGDAPPATKPQAPRESTAAPADAPRDDAPPRPSRDL